MRSFLLILIIFALTALYLQSQEVYRQVLEVREKSEFQEFELFGSIAIPIGEDSPESRAVRQGDILTFNKNPVQKLLERSPDHFQLLIPRSNGQPLLLDLIASNIFGPGFNAFLASDRENPVPEFPGLHYKGVVHGDPHSLVAISIFEEEIMGIIGLNKENYNLGKLKDNREGRHILYKKEDLKEQRGFDCHAKDVSNLHKSLAPQAAGSVPGNCVNIYIEADYNIFQNKGSVAAAINYVTGFFNQSAVLFENDSINIALSELVVWDMPSPYTGPNYLTQFRNETGTGFNGDLAHLVSFSGGGGVAYVDVLCNKSWAKAYSGVNSTYQNVPVYSWTVEVFTHETGHNMGSGHTHGCYWNGNNTQIDDCGNVYLTSNNFDDDDDGTTDELDEAEGSSCFNPNNLIYPGNGGTIMSYCHLIGGVGINFNEGFGLQPKNLIRNEIANAFCLDTCNANLDSSYCYSQGNSIGFFEEWIANVTVDTFSNSSGVGTYSDFTNLTLFLKRNESYNISLTPGYSGTVYNEYWRAWIDFNRDFDFTDPGEEIFSGGPSGTTVNGMIFIPDSAMAGTTRMRVSMSFDGFPNPCDVFSYGEVEDYSVEILVDCLHGNDTIPPQAICQDAVFCLDTNEMQVITPDDIDGGSTDNCSLDSLWINADTFTIADLGSNPVMLTVSDTVGNTDTCKATVTIEDCHPPTALCRDVTIELDSSGNATVSEMQVDNGSFDSEGQINLMLSQTAFDCDNLGDQSVILTVEDENNNTDTCSALIWVVDSIWPVATCQDDTTYLNSHGETTIAPLDIGSAWDNCPGEMISLSENSFSCTDTGSNQITFTVVDASGNKDSCTTNFVVLDTVSPVAVCQDVTVYLDGSGNGSVMSVAVNDGSDDNCGIASLNLSDSTFTCADIGINQVSLQVEDLSGNKDSCTASVTVLDTISPSAACKNVTLFLDSIGQVGLAPGEVVDNSFDNCNITGLSLSDSTFSCVDIGANVVTLQAFDQTGNTSQCTATITVSDSLPPPEASCQDITVYLDSSGQTEISPDDVENGSLDNCDSITLALSDSSFICSNIGPNQVTLEVMDQSANMSSCTTTVTVFDTVAPKATCQDVTVYLNGSGNGSTTSAAVNDGSNDNCGSVSLSLSDSTFTCSDLGGNPVTLTVTDGSSNQSTCQANATVLDTLSPAAECQDVTVYLNGSGNGSTTSAAVNDGSNDNCGSVSLSLSDSTFTCSDLGGNPVTLTVTDGSSNQSTCQANATVLDTLSPAAECQDVTVYLNGSGNGSTTSAAVNDGSNDNCGSVSLSLSDSTFTCSDLGGNPVTLTVTDGSSNLSTCQANATVLDTLSPAVFCKSDTLFLDSKGQATLVTNDVNNGTSDNCGLDSLFLDREVFGCEDLGSNPVVLIAKDHSQNLDSCLSTVTVIDSIVPTAICRDVTIELETGEEFTLPADSIDAGSFDNCQIDLVYLSDSIFNDSDTGVNYVILHVVDQSGLADTCLSNVTVDLLPDTSGCPDSLVVDDVPIPSGIYQAGVYLISTGQVNPGDTVGFGSGQEIGLIPSFEVFEGGFFHAYIDTCPKEALMAMIGDKEASDRADGEFHENPFTGKLTLRVFPNPFYQTTTFEYFLPETQSVHLRILNMTGEIVSTIHSGEETNSGWYQGSLDASDWPAGVYLIILQTDREKLIKKLILMK